MIERINNCYYNHENRCTKPKSWSGYVGASGRTWDSKMSCTFTQDGAQGICSDYKFKR